MAQLSDMRTRLGGLSSLKGPFPAFDAELFPPDPQAAFSAWLDDAIAAEIKEPHAMTLSTVDENGRADARVLILKDVDGRGWHFSIRGNSPKGLQISHHPDVALTFYWAQLGRQVRIRGKAVQLSEEECAQDFRSRPTASKVSAFASNQSQVLESHDELTRGLEAAQKAFRDNPDLVAEDWKVFSVSPESVEFWQGSSDRLHQRVLYTPAEEGKWTKQRLWP